MKLSVIVLVFNEVKTILRAIEEACLIGVAEKEIIVIDNGSFDGTRELLQGINDPSIKIIYNHKNLGPGKSVQIGISEAKGEYIYIHHADLEYPISIVPEMLNLMIKEKSDVILGSRLKGTNKNIWQAIKERPEYAATILTTTLVNIFYKKNFTDIIGSRLYRASSIREIPISTYGVGFEFEHISRICRHGLHVLEIAIPYKARKEGKKAHPRHIFNAIGSLFKVRIFG